MASEEEMNRIITVDTPMAKGFVEKGVPSPDVGAVGRMTATMLWEATIFDATALSYDFLMDTGEAAYDEMENTGQRVTLPHDVCYFEFQLGLAVIAWTFNVEQKYPPIFIAALCNGDALLKLDKDLKDDNGFDPDDRPERAKQLIYRCQLHYDWPSAGCADHMACSTIYDVMGVFENGRVFNPVAVGKREPQFLYLSPAIDDPDKRRFGITLGVVSRLMLGVLALMDDKLLLDRQVPAQMTKLNRSRAKKGRPPLDGDHHILTLNIPAVRYAASRAARQGEHESPCLHWRRGHHRVLWRGSEFEKKTWVRRCLVGDPDKGFIKSDYRLTMHLPMPD